MKSPVFQRSKVDKPLEWNTHTARKFVVGAFLHHTDHMRWERDCFPEALWCDLNTRNVKNPAVAMMDHWIACEYVDDDCFDDCYYYHLSEKNSQKRINRKREEEEWIWT
jgi:hypothetical protein